MTASYRGVFKHGVRYARGELVTRSGALWACAEDGAASAPSAQSAAWRLVVPMGYFGMRITRHVVENCSKAANEDNDCAVRAVAVALQIPYAQAHAAAKSTGRQHGQSWPFEAALCVLGAFGIELPACPATVREFEREFGRITGGFVLVQPDDAEHVAGVFGGVVHDRIAGSNAPLARLVAVAPTRDLLKAMLFQHYADDVADVLLLHVSHYTSRVALSASEVTA